MAKVQQNTAKKTKILLAVAFAVIVVLNLFLVVYLFSNSSDKPDNPQWFYGNAYDQNQGKEGDFFYDTDD